MRMGKAKRLLPHVIGISGGFCVNRRNLPRRVAANSVFAKAGPRAAVERLARPSDLSYRDLCRPWREVRGWPVRRDRKDQLNLANVGRETNPATHAASITGSKH